MLKIHVEEGLNVQIESRGLIIVAEGPKNMETNYGTSNFVKLS